MSDTVSESKPDVRATSSPEYQFGEWYPIETAPVHEFNAETWFMPGEKVLLWVNWACFGNYRYTKRAKGKWESDGRNVYPTHWMPAPDGPKC